MQFFKHYTNMRNDVKINRVIRRYGLSGYGLYNLIVETIAESLSSDHPLPEMEETAADIADKYNDDTTKINEMMAFMLNQGLFELNEITGRILCNKIYKFIDKSQTRSEEIRNMINTYKTSLCQGQSGTIRDNHDIADRSRSRIEVDKEVEEEKNTAIMDLTNMFYGLIKEKVQPPTFKNKPPNIESWYKDIEKLHRIDGATVEDIRGVIEYVVTDDFWKMNVLSGDKLRKHFDRLYLQYKKNTPEPEETMEERLARIDRMKAEGTW